MKSISPNKLASASGGGAIQSVNTQTGAVSLGIEDLDDFGLNDAGATSSVTRTPESLTHNIGSGGVGYGQINYGITYWDYGSEGYNGSNILTYLRDTATFPIDVDINGLTVTISSVRVYPSGNTTNLELNHSNFINNISTNVDWVLSLPNAPSEPLANGDMLQYVSAESKFKPVQLGVNDISDVDTSTVAPTDGQALVWDNANSKWEPGTISSGTTLPSAQDGAALIYENGAWIAGPVVGGVSYTSAADPEYSNVQLLLHCNGTNGSTTFTDSSQNGLSIAANGNSQISTAQYKFGGASAYFDGASNGIQVNNSALITGTGQFTIEMWFYAISLDGGLVQSSQFNGGYELGLYTSGLNFWTYNGSNVLTATAPSTNAWHHVAVTRDASNVLRMFVDGVLADSATGFTENLYRNQVVIGTSRTNFYDFEGYVDDFRLTTGVARYTAAFTPPTAQLPGAGQPVTIPYSIDKLADVDTSTVAPTDGQALLWDNANSKWEPGTVSGGGIARSEVSGTTASIADAASADLTITNTGKAGQLLSIETSAAAWVTVYASQATRTADASRTETTDPTAGSGVLAEVITTGAQTVLLTPGATFFNSESTPASELYLKVVNKSGSSAAIAVTLNVLPIEI